MAAAANFDFATDNPDLTLQLLDAADGAQTLRAYTHLVWSILEPGKPLVYGWHMDAIAEHLEAVTRGEIRRLVINVPPGFSKALDVNEPVLTIWGWKCHGEIEPGDFVYGPDGEPKRVVAVSEKREEPCYRVLWSDGAEVIAGEGHLWDVLRDSWDHFGRRARMSALVRTPDLKTGARPDAVDVAPPIRLGPKRLLINPYTLGAWLGDGGSTDGVIYAGAEDVNGINQQIRGHVTEARPASGRGQAFYRIRVDGLRVRLRVLGLLGDKRIPDDYLEAGLEQRWELLRGLLDTDGHCSANGRPCFSNTNKELAHGVQRLAWSLGLKATCTRHASLLDGVRYRDSFRVSFTARPGDRVFHLDRKQGRVRGSVKQRSFRRYLVSVEPVGERVVSCLQVDGTLYLAGHGLVTTHNSLMTNVLWPSWEWGPKDMPWLRYLSFAYAQQLTIRDNRRCRNLITSPLYRQLWGDRFNLVSDQNAKVRYDTNASGFRLASSVGGTGTGERGDRIVIDDPNNVRESESEKIIDSTLTWLTEVVPSRTTDIRTSAIVVIQQRTSVNDVTGHILKSDLGYEWLCLPMEYEATNPCFTPVRRRDRPKQKAEKVRLVKLEEESVPRWVPVKQKPAGLVATAGPVRKLYRQDRRTVEGEGLDPERFPQREVESDLKAPLMSRGGSAAVAGQLQQRPQPRGGSMFKRESFKFVDPADLPKGLLPARGYDLAGTGEDIGRSKKSAYSAAVKLAVDFEADDVYVLDVARVRYEPGAVVKWMQAMAKADGLDVHIDFPQDPAQAGKWQVGFLAGKLAGYRVFSSPESGSKPERAQPFASQAELGNVYLVAGGAWVDAFIAEAVNFPRGDFKDQIDAAARAYARALMRAKRAPTPAGPKVFR